MPQAGFPSGARYVEALQNTRLCFQDAELRGASARLDRLGRPRAISGNFASVFSLTSVGGKRYAVKCFTREVVDQELRYQAISDHLTTLAYPWKVGFDYLHDGILVDGKWYPVLRMEWVDAISLTRWIEQHLHDQGAVWKLAERFASLVAELEASNIGHGDLQHGNLLVASDGTLRLVDYDGMYVPALAGLPAAELGHRNYQPPARSVADFGPHVDRFSALVVYLSLIGIAADPTLWGYLRDPDAEQLLLAEDDYQTPDGSFRFGVLVNHHDKNVRSLAEQLRAALTEPTTALPPLIHVEVGSATPATPAAQAIASPTSEGGLPNWMAGHLVSESEPLRSFSRRPTAVRAFGIVTVIFAVLAIPAAMFGGLAAVVLPVILITTWVAASLAAYRRQPETEQAKSARAAAKEAAKAAARASRSVAQLDAQDRDLKSNAEKIKASFAARQRNLTDRHRRELAAVQHETQRAEAGVAAKISKLNGEKTRAMETELRKMQAEHVRTQLMRMLISDARLTGIGPTLVGNLRASGIVTAADFTEIVYSIGQNANPTAYFKLADGRLARVTGIGEVKARRLDAWRTLHLKRVQGTQPTGLPAAIMKLIENRFAAQEASLKAERGRLRTESDRQRTILAANQASELAALSDELRKANTEAARVQSEHTRKVQQARAAQAVAHHRRREATAHASAYANVSYGRFVRFIMTRRSNVS